MKWIKTAIGALIAISVIPLVVLSVINIKKSLETEKITITVELEYDSDFEDEYYFNLDIPFDVLYYDYYKKGFAITNLYDYTNDINITITNWTFRYPYEMVDNNSVYYCLTNTTLTISKTYDSIYNVDASDIDLMGITFARTNVNLVATLLSFVPLIFAGGVVLYFYNPFKKERG